MGTPIITVASGRRSSTSSTSKRGRKITSMPLSIAQWSATNSPWTWKIGSVWSNTSSGPNRQISWSATAFDSRLACVSIAPFERPVVPEVYSIAARSSAPRSITPSNGDAASARAAKLPVPSTSSPSTGTDRWSSVAGRATTSAGVASSTKNSTSVAVYAVLSGRNTAPMRRHARYNATASGDLSICTTTRSPTETPRSRSAPAIDAERCSTSR